MSEPEKTKDEVSGHFAQVDFLMPVTFGSKAWDRIKPGADESGVQRLAPDPHGFNLYLGPDSDVGYFVPWHNILLVHMRGMNQLKHEDPSPPQELDAGPRVLPIHGGFNPKKGRR